MLILYGFPSSRSSHASSSLDSNLISSWLPLPELSVRCVKLPTTKSCVRYWLSKTSDQNIAVPYCRYIILQCRYGIDHPQPQEHSSLQTTLLLGRFPASRKLSSNLGPFLHVSFLRESARKYGLNRTSRLCSDSHNACLVECKRRDPSYKEIKRIGGV